MKLITAVTIFALLIAAVFGALSLALTETTDLLDLQSRQLARAGESIRVAQSVKNRLLEHNRDAFLYQISNDPARFTTLGTRRDEIGALLLEAEFLINNAEERLVVDRVVLETEAYLARLDILENEALPIAEKFNFASVEADNAIAAVDQLTAVNRRQMEDLSQAIREQNRAANIIAGALFIAGAAILSGVAYAVFRFITRPLAELARKMALFTTSGVSAPVEPSGVNEIRALSANFNSLTERLEEKRQDQLRFIASIAHDLRNPLNSMSIATELLLRQLTDESKRMMELVHRQVKVLDRLVSDLLDTAHIESGHLEVEPSQQDIRALIVDTVELNRATAGVHTFKLELAGELDCVCDGTRISQVIHNLVANALKYSPNGGLVTVRAWQESGFVVVSVTDQGIGIEPDDLQNIFKPFNRAKATRGTIPGIGLGLSTSRRILEAHGGTLDVSSQPGKGATFRIRLPCVTVG